MADRIYKGKSLIKEISDYMVVDIETTGLSPRRDSIIEIAALKVRNNEITDTFTSLINPGFDIPTYITKLTGITNEMLKDAPKIDSVLPGFIDFLSDDVIVGHNVSFDVNFLYDESVNLLSKPLKNDFIDTMRIARKLFPDAPHHRLQDISAMLFVNYTGAHRAEQDCYITYQCYLKLIDNAREQFGSVETLFPISQKRVTSKPLDSNIMLSDDIYFPLKTVCLSGNFKYGRKADIATFLISYGANVVNSVNKQVDYVIAGELGNDKWKFGDYGTKINHAIELRAKGYPIEILRESDVLQSTETINENELEIIKGHAIAACSIDRYPGELFNCVNNYNDEQIYGFSILFNSSLIFRFNIIDYSIVVHKKYEPMIIMFHGNDIKELNSPQNYIKSVFTKQSDVIEFIHKLIPQFVNDYPPSERFGCCHRYVECSDAGKCTAPNLFHAKGCFYRENLENGRVFYGKNANI